VTKEVRCQTKPKCLAQINKIYCEYCSNACPLTYVCVLILMGECMKLGQIVLPSQNPIDHS
jgi:hypothetical protein